jgi:hypothetical protein
MPADPRNPAEVDRLKPVTESDIRDALDRGRLDMERIKQAQRKPRGRW